MADLPAGRYRAVIDAQSRRELAPPAFEVSGRMTYHELLIDLPADGVGWLEVFAEDGRRLEQGEFRPVHYRDRWGSQVHAPWIRYRECKTEGAYVSEEFSMDSGLARPRGSLLRAQDRGFALEGVREANHGTRHTCLFDASFSKRTAVQVSIDPDRIDLEDPEALHFVAVTGELSDLLPAILLPDGRDATLFPGQVEAHCLARPARDADGDTPWLMLHVEVRVSVPGHVPLHFRWRPADGPPANRVLELKPN